jgi:alanine dehydrogenase
MHSFVSGSRSLSDWLAAIEASRAAYKAPGDEAGTPGRNFAQTAREWLRMMPLVPPSGQVFGAKSIAGSFAEGFASAT